MENNFLLTDDLLWDYVDGFLEGSEKLQVEAYLQQHPAHRIRLESIQEEKRAFASLTLEKPGAGFADRVMAAWVSEQTLQIAPAKPRDWILLSIAGVIGFFLLVAFALVIAMAPEAAPLLTIPEQYVPTVPVIDWAMILGSNIFRYGLILMLALFTLQVLDKYLQQRNRLSGLIHGQ